MPHKQVACSLHGIGDSLRETELEGKFYKCFTEKNPYFIKYKKPIHSLEFIN